MYIGLDLGTSGVNGVLINGHQDIRAEATAPLSVSRPHKGWSEQDPETWKTAVDSVMRELRVSADLSGVKGDRSFRPKARRHAGPLCQGSCPLLYFSLFFQVGGNRTLTWDTHRNADLRC